MIWPKPKVWWGIPAALVLGLAVGRSCAPTRTVEIEAKVNQSLKAQADAAALRTAELEHQLEVARSQVRVRRIYVRKPDGTVVARETSDTRSESSSEKATGRAATASSSASSVTAATESSTRARMVERDLPDWRVGMGAGQVLGNTLKPSYGFQLQRRIGNSPFNVWGQFDTKRELWVGFNLEL